MQAAQWNPNSPHTVGLEFPNQGASFRRIAGLQQQLYTFKSLATETVASGLIPAGPGTVATSQVPPRKPKFAEAIPDYASVPMNPVEGVICADIGYPPQAVYVNEYAVSGIGGIMNGIADHRYSRNDDVGLRFNVDGTPAPSVDTINTGLASDVQTAGDGNWLSDPRGGKNLGSSSFTFDSVSFPSGRHVLAVEFVVRSNGPVMVTFANNDTVPGTWRTSPARVYFDSKEFQDNVYRIGEAYMENRDGTTNEIWRLTPLGFVRGFSSSVGLRRLVVATDATPQAAPLVRVRVDHILMRVYSTDETRQATGWVAKDGRVTFRVPSDVRRSTDSGPTPAPYSKTLDQTQNVLLRQYYPGNIPMPSMVLSTPRVHGTASFSEDWEVRDTIGHPQTYGPTTPTQTAEPAVASLAMFPTLGADIFVTAETQPYFATGGVFPYSGDENTTKPTTKNFPTGIVTNLAYALVSDTLGPKNNITFTLGSTIDAGGTFTTVTMTPEEIAQFPVVGYSTVSGEGNYGTDLPWSLNPTPVRWRRVRILFPSTITFEAAGGRFSAAALPNSITREGFVENYLIGAVFPQTKGGLYPLQRIFGDSEDVDWPYGVPMVTTAGTYTSPQAYVDLQVTFGTTAPTPVVSASLIVDDTSPTLSHPRVSWAWAAGGGLGATRFEVERYDDITGYWQRIMEVPTAGAYDDYEARLNTVSIYRVRVVRTDGVESAWTTSSVVTPVLGACMLAFSSNFDNSIYSTYVDTYSNDTTHKFTYRDAAEVTMRRIYGQDYESAFRQHPTGGVEFTRNILLPTGSTSRPLQNVNEAILEMTRNPTIPYVCVRDSNGNRWFSSVTQTSLLTTRTLDCTTPVAVASLNIVETAKDPSIILEA